MAVLTYNISSQLKDSLEKIEALRSKIHLFPLSPKEELRYRWKATAEKIYWSLSLAQIPISKEVVFTTLSDPPQKRLNNLQKDILNYKKALDYIRYEWLGSKQKITPSTIKKLYDIACKPTLGSSEMTFKSKKGRLTHFLDYLQSGNEHPIVQAGVAYIQVYTISPFTDGVGRVARLVANLFLYKHGYDFRGLLVFDEFMRRDLLSLRKARESVRQNNTLTLWLEYFAYVIGKQAEEALRSITTGTYVSSLPASFWKLNKRQKQILTLLDSPQSKITNREVQKTFKVSQITASRDLSKLANLNLLIAYGKGRSRYYIRGGQGF